MVCFDGFVLSHTMMPVEIPDAGRVRNFLPPYKPHTILSPEDPKTINPVLFPWRRENTEGTLCDGYMEMRFKLQAALDGARDVIIETDNDFADVFGRKHGGMLWEYKTEDAEVILTAMGSIASEASAAADILRNEGMKAGVVGIRVFRPFPRRDVREAFKKAKAIVMFEKAISYGYEGGLCSDLKAAFYGTDIKAPIHGYIAGLGGRDVKARELADAAKTSLAEIKAGHLEKNTTWLNCYTGRILCRKICSN